MLRAASLELGTAKVRVLVADCTPLTACLIAEALRRDRGLTITNPEASPVVVTATILKPDVAVVSEQLQGRPGKGFEVLRELRLAVPRTRTVMLLDSAERHLVVEAFRSGARGVFCRSDPLKMLARCVHKVHQGQLWVSSTQLEFLLEALTYAPTTRLVDTQGTDLLSKREQDVVRWLAEGNTNGQIAHELKISENTVKNYLFRIFNKIGVSSRVELVIYAANQRFSRQSVRLEALASTSTAG
jgi:two-component system, NarL family, nitrate/nitrite response regulator NarL